MNLKFYLLFNILALSFRSAYSASSSECQNICSLLLDALQEFAAVNTDYSLTDYCGVWNNTADINVFLESLFPIKDMTETQHQTQINGLREMILNLIFSKIDNLKTNFKVKDVMILAKELHMKLYLPLTFNGFLLFMFLIKGLPQNQDSYDNYYDYLASAVACSSFNQLVQTFKIIYPNGTNQDVHDLILEVHNKLQTEGYKRHAEAFLAMFLESPISDDPTTRLEIPELKSGYVYRKGKKGMPQVKIFSAPELPPVPKTPLITGYDIPDFDYDPIGEGWLASRRLSPITSSWRTPKKLDGRKYRGKWEVDMPSVDYEEQFKPFASKPTGRRYYRRLSEREAALEERKLEEQKNRDRVREQRKKMWGKTAGYRDLKGSYDDYPAVDEQYDDIGPSPIEESISESYKSSAISSDSSDDSSDTSSETSSIPTPKNRYRYKPAKLDETTVVSPVEPTPIQLPILTKTMAIQNIQNNCKYLVKAQKSRALALYKLLAWLADDNTQGWDVKPFCHAVYYSERKLYGISRSELPKTMARICVRELSSAQWIEENPELLKNIPKVCYGFYKKISDILKKSKL